jgi:hypothetical protein
MSHDTSKWTIDTFFQMEGSRQLQLQPDFQRFYIWDLRKEQLFIDSILRKYPVPPVWMWKHRTNGHRRIHEIVDGQQRLTCIRRFINNEFPYKYPNRGEEDIELAALDGCYFDRPPAGSTASALPETVRNRLMDYMISYIVVETDNRDLILDIFSRLNKSSTNLTPQELRNAFYRGAFKSYIYDRTASLQDCSYWGVRGRVFERKTTDRMADQQFLSDLVVALIEREPQHQSKRLDDFYARYDEDFPQQQAVNKRLNRSLRVIKKAMPEPSRFTRNLSDFYTLFLLVDEFGESDGICIESDVNVQVLRESLTTFERDYALFLEGRGRSRGKQSVFEEYRETIVGRQREKEVREARRLILRELIEPALKRSRRDSQRLFNEEQKLYIWQSSSTKNCEICGLEVSDFDDYEPDHIKPWANGGRTAIANGRITHRRCNRSRQNREAA